MSASKTNKNRAMSSSIFWLMIIFCIKKCLSDSSSKYEIFNSTVGNKSQRRLSVSKNIEYLKCDGDNFSLFFDPSGMAHRRFISVGQLPNEQLSKARMHFADILAFARMAKRTLVLPSCGEGKLTSSTYSSLPFCSYFDLEKLGEFVDWVSEDFFFKFHSQVALKEPFYLFIGDDCHVEQMVKTYKPFFPASNNNSKLVAKSAVERHHLCLPCRNTARKVSFPSTDDSDLLVVSKRTIGPCAVGNHSLFALKHLRYSKELRDMAAEFADKVLGNNFLAIQWRIEKSIRENIGWKEMLTCMRGLEKTVKAMNEKYRLSGLFLATDAPHGSTLASTSALEVDKDKISWLEIVSKSLTEKLNPVKWTEFYPSFYELDSGVRGILEKLVCVRSKVFIYPPSSCFNRKEKMYVASSYLREIISMRNASDTNYGTPLMGVTAPWEL